MPVATEIARRIDVKRALELRLQGLSYTQVGLLLCPAEPFSHQAVQQHLARFERLTQDSESLDAFQSNRTKLLDAVEFKLLDSLIADDRIAKASLNNVAYAFTQIHTARRLETGESTANVSVMSKLVTKADDDLFDHK